MSLNKKNYREEQVLLKSYNVQNGAVSGHGSELNSHQLGMGLCEKTLVINSEPVKLTPAWEEKNLPNDELNFKSITLEDAQLEINPPKDRFNIVFLILMLHGIGILLPWNMFINAKSYFMDYKLSYNYTHTDTTVYTSNFLVYLGLASQVPSVIFSWLNIFINLKGSLTKRIVWSITVGVIIFTITVVLVMVDTSTWPDLFFYFTLGSVFILNSANAIYQNTIYGVAARLPSVYSGTIVLGNNISGTFTAVVSMLTRVFAPDAKTAAIYYFVTALFVLLICFDTYFALPLNKFYKYHDTRHQRMQKQTNERGVSESVPYWRIFKKCSMQCFNAFFIFFITLSIFPSIYSDIKKSNESFPIKDSVLFMDVTCFFTFNFCAMLGNLLATFVTKPGPNKLFICVLLRIVFIPLFLICNYQPQGVVRVMPLLITNDWIYWFISVLFSFTSGYFSSLAMMYCSKTVEPQYAVKAAMFGGGFLVLGVGSGILFSAVFPWLVSVISW